MEFLIICSIFLLLLILSVPIGISVCVSVCVSLFFFDVSLYFVAQRMFNTFDVFSLLSVPCFIFAGYIMQQGSIAKSLINLCLSFCGHIKGNLAHISVITCFFDGALSGSSIATTTAIGGIMIPYMKNEGFPVKFSAAVNVSSGVLGAIIPPSIHLIIYGSVVGCSVGDLFIASIIPGIILAILFLCLTYTICVYNNYGNVYKKQTWKCRFGVVKDSLIALCMPIIVMGSIYGGIATPTEASAVAVIYALVVECFITKSITKYDLLSIIDKTVISVGSILFIIIFANAMGTLLIYYDAGNELLTFLNTFVESRNSIIFICFVLFLFLGCFIEAGPIIILLCPILEPILLHYGIDLIHFGIFMLLCLCIGNITPPVGNNLFVGNLLTGVDILSLSKACIPFIIAMVIVSLLVGYIPEISLFLLGG